MMLMFKDDIKSLAKEGVIKAIWDDLLIFLHVSEPGLKIGERIQQGGQIMHIGSGETDLNEEIDQDGFTSEESDRTIKNHSVQRFQFFHSIKKSLFEKKRDVKRMFKILYFQHHDIKVSL